MPRKTNTHVFCSCIGFINIVLYTLDLQSQQTVTDTDVLMLLHHVMKDNVAVEEPENKTSFAINNIRQADSTGHMSSKLDAPPPKQKHII